MKLYHVSYNKVDRFIPRVPKERAEGENDDIPRICFSDSIEKCIAAKPSGPTALEIAEEEGIPVCLYVYSIDTEDYDKHDLLILLKYSFGAYLMRVLRTSGGCYVSLISYQNPL